MKSIRGLNLSSIDELIENLEDFSSLGKRKQDIEWEELKNNYNKLMYVHRIFQKIPQNEKLLLRNPLETFLFSIDKKTQYYLHEIDWWDPDSDVLGEQKEIGNIFLQSLNLSDPFDKLTTLIDGYSKLFVILEDCGRCGIHSEFDDQEFKKQFSF